MEGNFLIYVFICISILVVVDSQCAGGQHECFTAIGSNLASVAADGEICSKIEEYKDDIDSCKVLIESDCDALYQPILLDVLSQSEELLTNATDQLCGEENIQSCFLELTSCFENVPELVAVFESDGIEIHDVCKAYNDVDDVKITEVKHCMDSTSCPAAPPPGEAHSSAAASFYALKSIDAVCSCDSFQSKFEECGPLADSMIGQSGLDVDCKKVEMFACCAKPLVKDCPDVWFLVSNPPDIIGEDETFDIALRHCKIDPERMEGDTISGDKCSSIYNGSATNHNLHSFLLIKILLLMII